MGFNTNFTYTIIFLLVIFIFAFTKVLKDFKKKRKK